MVNCEEGAQGLHYLFCKQWHLSSAAASSLLPRAEQELQEQSSRQVLSGQVPD